MENTWVKETCLINDMAIYCEHAIKRNKPPLLLLHGFMSSTYTFHKIFPVLQEYFSVVTVDLPGFGRSEKSTSFIYSYHHYGMLVNDILTYFNLQNVIVVGHSMGGQIALNLAKIVPCNINKLILIGCSGYLKRSRKRLIYCSYIPFFDKLMALYINKHGVASGLKNVFYDQSFITNSHIEEFGRPLKDKKMYKSLVRLIRHREGDLIGRDLNKIDLPVLLIWGREDRVVPVNVGYRLANDLPNCDLKVYEKAGHLITEERPDKVCEAILSYAI
ncbi:alpha/beta hydrolase [Salipaludibacillus agaradhaerens]|uniref:Alpha/beta hydrolase n=1 Tax=Salipaludibacillus agaradhaerens TaxID=76935 RepID=A0A9Q4FYZ3_SALAG|nr:alpha/beta hydrolase [Salipaludibacillus agaradhaerens]MCR6096258.1 alpha/beta hydrolase [Salipaludibacillus agaradhaerens]MCR6114183.1 alpha/beta hydrolase [Salipaludibacillus agaradhaerens]